MSQRVFVGFLLAFLTAAGCGGRSALRGDASANTSSDGRAGDSKGSDGQGTGKDGPSPDGGTTVDTRVPDVAVVDVPLPVDVAPPKDVMMMPDTNPVVTLVGIDISPALTTAVVGTTVTFVATGRFSDGSTANLTAVANWTSTVTTVATVSGGVAKAIAPGAAVIRAASMGQVGSATIGVTAANLVSLTVQPPDAKLPAMTKQQFTATGVF